MINALYLKCIYLDFNGENFSTFCVSFLGNSITATVLQYPYDCTKTVKAILFLIQAAQPNNIM